MPELPIPAARVRSDLRRENCADVQEVYTGGRVSSARRGTRLVDVPITLKMNFSKGKNRVHPEARWSWIAGVGGRPAAH